MAKRSAEEIKREQILPGKAKDQHPFAFDVSGPQNLSSPPWRDLIHSSWNDCNYKRRVVACFIQAAYLLELDRVENRTQDNALAPKWWIPFKYKLIETLIDERDGSIFGAILEWDRFANLSDLFIKPTCAPQAILVLRGTILNKRDMQDDLRFFALESLKGTMKFTGALKALKVIADKYGSSKVCIAGHSIGAELALQVGIELAQKGINIEAHLFNPPTLSIATSLRNIGETAGNIWEWCKSKVSSPSVTQAAEETIVIDSKWAPHLYVNDSDYICQAYANYDKPEANGGVNKGKVNPRNGNDSAKLFVLSKGNQKLLDAHKLEQWWSDDMKLQMAEQSNLMSRLLRPLHSSPITSPQEKQGSVITMKSGIGATAVGIGATAVGIGAAVVYCAVTHHYSKTETEELKN